MTPFLYLKDLTFWMLIFQSTCDGTLLSESKLKFAVYQNGSNYRKPFYEGNKSSVKHNKDFCPHYFQQRKRDIAEVEIH